MFCNKCGNQVGPNEKFCNKCGNPLGVLQNFQVNQTVTTNTTSFNNVNYNTQYANYNAQNNIQYTQGNTNNSNNKKMILIGASIGLGLILIVLLVLFFNGNNEEEYYLKSQELRKNIPWKR